MKGDYSRFTFDPRKRYTGVRMQQGRVQLDADWNEQVDLQLNRERRKIRDIVGHAGGPRGNVGFQISKNTSGTNLTVSAGHYYLAGRLCWNESQFEIDDFKGLVEGRWLAYLDVWERHITALEDDEIREPALGGPDTATRTQIVSRVRLKHLGDVGAGVDCSAYAKEGWVPEGKKSTGSLAARCTPEPSPPEPCVMPSSGGYTGPENHLYRVEIHAIANDGKTTFKWSRENGAVATQWKKKTDNTLEIAPPAKDEILGFKTGDVVELTDSGNDRAGHPGILAKLKSATDSKLVVEEATSLASLKSDSGTVRRWEDQGELPPQREWIALEDGIEIAFEKGLYQPGDYWTIPARAFLGIEEKGEILWPKDGKGKPTFENRHGPEHVYCPLAICTYRNGQWQTITSCQKEFPPLTDLPTDGAGSCCTLHVGPGESIQDGIDSLEKSKHNIICLLPGNHQLEKTVIIEQRSTRIIGCNQAIVSGPVYGGPAFEVRGGAIFLEKLAIHTSGKLGALKLIGQTIAVQECEIRHTYKTGEEDPICILSAYGDSKCTINDCFFSNTPKEHQAHFVSIGKESWVSLMGDRISFSQNELQFIGIIVWYGSHMIELNGNRIINQDAGILLGGRGYLDPPVPLGSVSKIAEIEYVEITNNLISGTRKSGILSTTERHDSISGAISFKSISISGNQIIGCCRSKDPKKDLESIEEGVAQAGIFLRDSQSVIIENNQIIGCGGSEIPACGVFLLNCNGIRIFENRLANNGCDRKALEDFNREAGKMAFQAGIVGMGLLDSDPSDRHSLNLPAASIQNNHVESPAGQALFLTCEGTVSIGNNDFRSLGVYSQPGWGGEDRSDVGCVAVINGVFSLDSIVVYPQAGRHGYSPTHIHEPDDQYHTRFHDNYVCLLAADPESSKMLFGVHLASHRLSVRGNQILSRLHDELSAVQLTGIGIWLCVAENLVVREIEGLRNLKESAGIGIFSHGFWNTTVHNQTNRCISATGTFLVNNPNQYPEEC